MDSTPTMTVVSSTLPSVSPSSPPPSSAMMPSRAATENEPMTSVVTKRLKSFMGRS